MKRRIRLLGSEEGQSLILIVLVMVAVTALLGLALDGGNLFLQRRRVQNAVDSASLAGTRILAKAICNQVEDPDLAIAREINHFAETNGIPDSNDVPGDEINDNIIASYINMDLEVLGTVGSGEIPADATGISVGINKPQSTFFIRIVGITEVDIDADAKAMTGPPLSIGSGIRPVAVPLDVLDYVDVGDILRFNFGNSCDDGESCAVAWTSHGGGDMSRSHRGWVNLGYAWNQGEAPDWGRNNIRNVSNANTKEWMENGYSANPFYADNEGGVYGDYIHASPGQRQTTIERAPIGQIIILPVFDYFVQYEDIPEPKPSGVAQAHADYYHVVGFLGVRVTRVLPTNQHAFEGEIVNLVISSGQVGQPNNCETHMMVINLWD